MRHSQYDLDEVENTVQQDRYSHQASSAIGEDWDFERDDIVIVENNIELRVIPITYGRR